MKFEISREKILPILIALNGVVEKKPSLPILSNVLIKAQKEEIFFIATDMEVERTIAIKNEVKIEGAVGVSARKLLDICRSIPEDSAVEISTARERVTVRTGKSRFVLAAVSAEQFPTAGVFVAELQMLVEPIAFRKILHNTQFAMAHQDVRYYLNGLLIEFDERKIRAVATDGHRLALAEKEMGVDASARKQIIIPRKGVTEIVKMLGGCQGEVEISASSNHIRIKSDVEDLVSKLIDGRFPDYEKVIPRSNERVVIVSKNLLREGLNRASILSNEKFKGVRLALEPGRIRATAQNAEQEEAEEIIEIAYDGPEIEIGFNVSYLIEALSAIEDEKVEIQFTDANSSCVIRGEGREDTRYVVMPMRL